MSVLQQRWLHPDMPSEQAMADAGGRWLVDDGADAASVVDEVRERGIRALEVRGDLSFVAALPELEFVVAFDPPDVAPLHTLERLRLLTFPGTWGGRVDGGAWPLLEWFGATEVPRGGGGVETLFGHPTLRDLGVQRAWLGDLRPITASRLESLSVAETRALTSLAGADVLAPTLLHLTLSMLPRLESLDGLERLERLEVLHLDHLRRITSLDVVAALPRLRFLDVMELAGVETLAPLAGHPMLEYLAFGPTVDLDLEPLFAIPSLELVLADPRPRWNRSVHELPYLHDVSSNDPRRREWNRLAVR